jgi:hypothetical protein
MRVYQTKDFTRVAALPRRGPVDYAALQAKWTEKLGRKNEHCRCAKFGRPCCNQIRPIQAQALEEISTQGGLLGPIGVGHGKSLVDLLAAFALPDVKTAVLLLPPQLKIQMLEFDIPYYEQHWKMPNLASSEWHFPGRPNLYVVGYSELSSKKGTDLLMRIKPDLIIADEAHALRNPSAARTKRFYRLMNHLPQTKFIAMSGTLVSKSFMDWAPMSKQALKEKSPAPLFHPDMEMWAKSLDPSDEPYEPGVLEHFGQPLAKSYGDFVTSTPGVVSSGDAASCNASLIVEAVYPLMPPECKTAIKRLESTWTRPDGEELMWQFDFLRALDTLSLGFYFRWKWVHNEPLDLRTEWLESRADWRKEVRQKLKHPIPHLDSPGLLYDAAKRYFKNKNRYTKKPKWNSETWKRWDKVKDKCRPESEAIWLSRDLLAEAVDWARSNVGIVWTAWPCFGAGVDSGSGGQVRYFGAGDEAARAVSGLSGKESVCLSTKAHGTGRNLQSFSRNLLSSVPGNGTEFEQILGRTHRQGQQSDEVTVQVWQHSARYRDTFERAETLANYIQDAMGTGQRLASVAQYLNFASPTKDTK